MEDRKRSAHSNAEEPPNKRQAVNGHGGNGGNGGHGGSSNRPIKDEGDGKDEPAWICEFQKDALYRQMQMYKRQITTLEEQLGEVMQKSAHHDEHLRVVDAWWIQLLQELKLLAESEVPSFGPHADGPGLPYPTHTGFDDVPALQAHLVDKAQIIKDLSGAMFARLAEARGGVTPDISKLEEHANKLLAEHKAALVQIQSLTADKEALSEAYNSATLRYMKAEHKLDRAKSAQVQQLEQQALANATSRPSASANMEDGSGDGESQGDIEALRLAFQEATAIAEKHKGHADTALATSRKLQEDLTTAQMKLISLADEDFSHTELWKLARFQYERLVQKVNHLEVENKTLASMTAKLDGDRESHRKKLEDEARTMHQELLVQLNQAETTLARVRTNRDELHAEVSMLKASKDQERTDQQEMKALLSAKDDFITGLNQQVKRLTGDEDTDMDPRPDIDQLAHEDLRDKYTKLERDFDAINKELPALTSALQKSQAAATKKTMDSVALQDRLAQAIAEKSKADQKYFSTRKTSDMQAEELKRLRSQYTRSSDIISQLKETEAQNRMLVANLQKQLTALKQTNATVMSENRRLEATANEALRRCDALKLQMMELNHLARGKDALSASATERVAELEGEKEKLKVRVEHLSKERDKWKTMSRSNSSEEEEMLRKLAQCPVCRNNFKDTVIKTCGHIFCHDCVEQRIQHRMRKCPACNKTFDKADAMVVHM